MMKRFAQFAVLTATFLGTTNTAMAQSNIVNTRKLAPAGFQSNYPGEFQIVPGGPKVVDTRHSQADPEYQLAIPAQQPITRQIIPLNVPSNDSTSAAPTTVRKLAPAGFQSNMPARIEPPRGLPMGTTSRGLSAHGRLAMPNVTQRPRMKPGSMLRSPSSTPAVSTYSQSPAPSTVSSGSHFAQTGLSGKLLK